jgi:hypothetical protein
MMMDIVINTLDVDRVAALRKRCRDRKRMAWVDPTWVDYHSFLRSSSVQSLAIRIGHRTCDRLTHLKFDLDDLELLVGRPAPKPDDIEELEYRRAKEYLASLPYASTPGQTGHCELNRQIVLRHGIDGALQILQNQNKLEGDAERNDTYQSFIFALEGLQSLILEFSAEN